MYHRRNVNPNIDLDHQMETHLAAADPFLSMAELLGWTRAGSSLTTLDVIKDCQLANDLQAGGETVSCSDAVLTRQHQPDERAAAELALTEHGQHLGSTANDYASAVHKTKFLQVQRSFCTVDEKIALADGSPALLLDINSAFISGPHWCCIPPATTKHAASILLVLPGDSGLPQNVASVSCNVCKTCRYNPGLNWGV